MSTSRSLLGRSTTAARVRTPSTRVSPAAGVTEVELERLELDDSADAPEWAERERALLRATDELAVSCAISDPTWAALARHYGAGQLVEIPFVVGQYVMLSMVANALGIGA